MNAPSEESPPDAFGRTRAMTWTPPPKLVDAVGALMLTAAVAFQVVDVLLREVPVGGTWGPRYLDLPLMLVLPALGWLLARRRPENPVSWLLLLAGFMTTVSQVAEVWSNASLGWGWPAGQWALLVADVIWPWTVGPLFLAVARFPDGARARGLGRLAEPAIVVALLAIPFAEGSYTGPLATGIYDNPIGWSEHNLLLDSAALSFVVLIIAAAANLLQRMRTATGVRRQQLRWVRAAMVFALVGNAGTIPLLFLQSAAIESSIAASVSMVTFLVVVGSLTVAVLRYRLYELDRIISRTLTYALLTIALLAVYLGTVLTLSAVLSGGVTDDPPSWVVATSTLVAYAVFAPLRSRLQAVIDRRLYRSRDDAREVVARLGAELRDGIALSHVEREVLHAVASTLHPTTVSLWRSDEDRDVAVTAVGDRALTWRPTR